MLFAVIAMILVLNIDTPINCQVASGPVQHPRLMGSLFPPLSGSVLIR